MKYAYVNAYIFMQTPSCGTIIHANSGKYKRTHEFSHMRSQMPSTSKRIGDDGGGGSGAFVFGTT